jgi:hypothetical protein
MVKCHVRTFRQDLSVTRDKSQTSARQVPYISVATAWLGYGLKLRLMAPNGWLTAKPQLILHLADLVQLISSMLGGVQDYIS